MQGSWSWFGIKALELESFGFELDRNRKMFEQGLVAEDEIRLSETSVERARIELRHLETQLLNSEQDLAARLEGSGARDLHSREGSGASAQAPRSDTGHGGSSRDRDLGRDQRRCSRGRR